MAALDLRLRRGGVVDEPVDAGDDDVGAGRGPGALQGREEVVQFLTRKWAKENGYRLRKELFSFTDHKIAVQVSICATSCVSPLTPVVTVLVRVLRSEAGRQEAVVPLLWSRGEHAPTSSASATRAKLDHAQDWTFAENGQMRKRQMSGNDVPISEEERWYKDDVADEDTVEISEKHW